MFLSIVGAEAGHMALRSLASGGVYICGGIFPKVGGPAPGVAGLLGSRPRGPGPALTEGVRVWPVSVPHAALHKRAPCPPSLAHAPETHVTAGMPAVAPPPKKILVLN